MLTVPKYRGRGFLMRKRVSRRDFLKMTGAGIAGASLLGAAGCGGGSASSVDPEAGMWKQFAGTTLNFVSENTSPTTAIAANLNPFKELTGINVNVLQLELGALVQKVALDIGATSGASSTWRSGSSPPAWHL
jgi:multiple sugar transport system substrate-binding protein